MCIKQLMVIIYNETQSGIHSDSLNYSNDDHTSIEPMYHFN